MPPLKPESIGDVPRGLPAYHREFLRRLRDAIEIMQGRQVTQSARVESLTTDEVLAQPRSQVVTVGNLNDVLEDLGLI